MSPLPRPPGIAGESFFGVSATMASVVISRPATEATLWCGMPMLKSAAPSAPRPPTTTAPSTTPTVNTSPAGFGFFYNRLADSYSPDAFLLTTGGLIYLAVRGLDNVVTGYFRGKDA